ncbi:hypothetical protein [Nitrosomonas sp. Nm33]|uniref:hypothetical protein n=1 Tax=Nitrosomonas sp. Nm33 TaxID=133724 RepID=UPI00210A23F3|nr:hypothetical protein [Nitrosomonas sp. Nm33]
MASWVATAYTIAILGEHGPIRRDEHRSKWLVTRFQGLGRQLYAAAQVLQVSIGQHNNLLRFVITLLPAFQAKKITTNLNGNA